MHKRTCISASILRTKHSKSVDDNREHRHMTWCQGGGHRPSHGPADTRRLLNRVGRRAPSSWSSDCCPPTPKAALPPGRPQGHPCHLKYWEESPGLRLQMQVMSRVVRYVLTCTDVLILLSVQLQIGRMENTNYATKSCDFLLNFLEEVRMQQSEGNCCEKPLSLCAATAFALPAIL